MKHPSSHTLASVFILLVVLVGCGEPNSTAFHLSSLATEQALTSGEITPFELTLDTGTFKIGDVEVIVDTLNGPGWHAALCYEELCFMHDGQEKLVKTFPLSASRRFELKMFVPEDAKPGDTTRVRVTLGPAGKASNGAAVELKGFLP